jgi:hypothetical protein
MFMRQTRKQYRRKATCVCERFVKDPGDIGQQRACVHARKHQFMMFSAERMRYRGGMDSFIITRLLKADRKSFDRGRRHFSGKRSNETRVDAA